MIIFMLPIYVVLIWSYFEPRESLMWGRRWMYDEEPELSGKAIRYTKIATLVSIIFITLLIVVYFIAANN
ncbi:hypothetical protein SAMN05216378_1446 [Paenibacillus catalpae]|uniref:Selenocysteine lyase n=1 Tax=Paenibacillus catalpae TaxID=1045775 RepID=A0A1I1V8D6_9BACL|nr:hypothetical protein SAMN05216378_1446 [Paenibacillus catalpae]